MKSLSERRSQRRSGLAGVPFPHGTRPRSASLCAAVHRRRCERGCPKTLCVSRACTRIDLVIGVAAKRGATGLRQPRDHLVADLLHIAQQVVRVQEDIDVSDPVLYEPPDLFRPIVRSADET